MQLKQIRRWLLIAYLTISFAFVIVISIFLFIAPVHFGKLVVSTRLAELMAFIDIVPLYAITRFVRRNSHRKNYDIIIGIITVVVGIVGTSIAIFHVVRNPQDVATLAIVWVFILPAIIFAIKSLIGGFFAAVGNAIGKRVVDEVTRAGDKNSKAE